MTRLFLLLLAFGLVACPDTRGRDDDDTTGDDDDAANDDDAADDDDSTPNPDAPVVTITAPADGALLNNPESVSLVGSATDDQDGDIASGDLEWSSDVDGDLGTGESIVVSLSVGEHELTLSAEDSDGNLGWATVDVEVVGENQLPSAFIDSPSDGALFLEGTTVEFEGSATDPEDGDLSGGSLFWTSTEAGSFGTGTNASLVGAALGPHTIVLTAVDSQGEQGIASIDIEVVPVGTNLPPLVTIASPSNGDAFTEGDTISLEGSADDPEDGPLTAGDLSWFSSVDGLLGTGETLDVDTLATGAHTISLTATDSDGLGTTESVQIVVNMLGNDAPVVEITAPADGSTVVGGTDVDFVGTATDPEDGPLIGASLTWTSSLDGVLGDGEEVSTNALSEGSHIVTLTAEDSAGGLGLDSIGLTVLAANTPPTVTISGPNNGDSFTQGDSIDFEGTATDAEDGPLTGSALIWQSNTFGQMGTGAPLSFSSLPAGLHQVTLIAVDSGGLSGSDSIEITIDPSAVNLPPVAVLSGPTNAEVGVPITLDGSGSSDPDGSIVDYEFDFGDSDSTDGTDDTVEHTYTAEGTFTVTLTVTDDEGETGEATLDVEVIIPEPVPEVVWDTAETFGSRCQLVVDSNDNPHVVFRNTTHPSLWYAVFDGTDWDVDFVDGPGFDIGGEVTGDISLAVDSGGDPHIAYRYTNTTEVRYATTSGSSWTRELVNATWDSSTSGNGSVGIALDPLNGERPTIAFSYYDNYWGYVSPTVAYRTGSSSWTEEQYTINSSGNYATGGIQFTASGVAWMTYDYNDGRVINWSSSAGFFDSQTFTDAFDWSSYMPLVLDSGNQPIVLTDEGTHHRQSTGDWIRSDVEPSDYSYYDIGINPAGDFYLGLQEGGDITLIHGDPYWTYEYQGPMDGAWPGIDVDSDGKVWACFFRDGNLMVY